MGVFRFGSFLDIIDNLKSAKYNIATTSSPPIDILCIDMNAVIHDIAASTMKSLNQISSRILADNIISYLKLLMENYNPKQMIIAVDGVPPMGKINQQRMRRIRYPLPEEHPLGWSPIFISVGTEWMDIIHQSLQSYSSTDSRIVYSSQYIPGEGEHKIFNYIRDKKLIGNILIIGNDSDLVLIALLNLTDKRNIIIQRQYFVHVNIVADILLSEYGMSGSDFVFISFFVGNDFLPPIPEFIDIRKSLTYLSNAYKTIKSKNKQFHLTNPINLNNLKTLLKSINMDQFKPTNLLITDNSFNYSYFLFKYKDYIKEDITSEMLSSYISMLKWIHEYYKSGDVSYSTMYRFHYTPTVLDIIQHISDTRDTTTVQKYTPYKVTPRQLQIVTIPPWQPITTLLNPTIDIQPKDLFPYTYIEEFKTISYTVHMKDKQTGKINTRVILGHANPIIPLIDYNRLIKL